MFPSPSDTGIGVVATKEANEADGKVIDRGASRNVVSKKRMAYTALFNETCADIGRYAAENGNAAALKKFCSASQTSERAQFVSSTQQEVPRGGEKGTAWRTC